MHESYRHIGQKSFIKLMKRENMQNFKISDVKRIIKDCESCRRAKAQANPVPQTSNNPATRVRQRIHCDAVMLSTPTIGGRTGYSLIVDEFAKEVEVKIITRKNETIAHLEEYRNRSEELGYKIEVIRTDSAAEFATNEKFKIWLKENGIFHEMSAPYSQYQNGVVERHIQMIEDKATAILIASGLPNGFLGEAMQYVAKTWNVTANDEMTPYEMVTGRKFDLTALKPFGCRVFIRKPLQHQQHMSEQAEQGIFIGYPDGIKGYKVVKDKEWTKCFIRSARDCTFNTREYPALRMTKDMEDNPVEIWIDAQQQNRGEDVERPTTPPLILDDTPYESEFMRDLSRNTRSGLRSG